MPRPLQIVCHVQFRCAMARRLINERDNLNPAVLGKIEKGGEHMRRTGFTLLTISLLVLSFGCGGKGGGDTTVNDHAYSVAIQSDGKIIAAGDSYDGAGHRWSFALSRYNSNGALDGSFGGGGKVLTPLDGGVRAIAVQSDGKIVAAGYNYDTTFLLLARYNGNGSLDADFGVGGTVLTNMGGAIIAVALQSDGKIVATAGVNLVRYNSDGSLSATFGWGGKVIMRDGASSIALQGDGKIVVAGGSRLARYNGDGSLDTTFGAAGEVITTSPYEQSSGVALQGDGKIVAAGSSYNGIGSYDFALTRYEGDGAPDTTFAGSGRVVTPVHSLYTLAPTTVIPDAASGKIVAAGYSSYQFVITRHNRDGSPDMSFVDGGKIITTGYDYWGGVSSSVSDLAVQEDGKIVVVGSSDKGDVKGSDFALARHNGDGSIDAAFGVNGKVITGF